MGTTPEIDITRYSPPGPVGASFIKSRGPIDVIMGPGGSGKTVASVIKGPMLAAEYLPVCKDGWVRAKMLCTRDTYRSFAATALASWYNTFPIGHPYQIDHQGGQDRPVKHTLAWETRRGADMVKIEFIMETGAPGDFNIEAFFKGYEITLGWANEYDLQHENTLPLMLQRCGRYPPMNMIADSELQRVSKLGREQLANMGMDVQANDVIVPQIVWGDMNPPDIDHPAYVVPFVEKKKGWNAFQQPGGLAPNAENRAGKSRLKYEMEAETTKDKHLVRRMVHGLPAYAKDGTPIYEDYFDGKRHVADQEIMIVPQWGVTIGIDSGGSPAATIGQHSPYGQNRLLAEVVSEPGTGPTRFGQMLLSVLMNRFPGMPVIGAWADPSAWFGADSSTGEFHWVNALQEIVRFPILPAPSQEPGIRIEAVKHFLGLNIDGRTPGYIIDPSCKKMIGGFEAHYKLNKKNSASETDKLQAVKNEYSHPHDAEQYRCLGHLGLSALVQKQAQATLPGNVTSIQARNQRQAQPVQRDRMDFKI